MTFVLLTITQSLKKISKKLRISIKKEKKFTALFLDFDINARHKDFKTEHYVKRNAFPFSMIRMSYQDSIMPLRNFYAAVESEISHLARTTLRDNFRTQ